MVKGTDIFSPRISMDMTIHRLVGFDAEQSLFLSWLTAKLNNSVLSSDIVYKNDTVWVNITHEGLSDLLFGSIKTTRKVINKLKNRQYIEVKRQHNGSLFTIHSNFIKEYTTASPSSFTDNYTTNTDSLLGDISGHLRYSGNTREWSGDINKLYDYMLECIEERKELHNIPEEDKEEMFECIMEEKGRCLISNQIFVKTSEQLFKYIAGYFHIYYRNDLVNYKGFQFDWIWTKLRKALNTSKIRSEYNHDYGERKFLYSGCMRLWEALGDPFEENLQQYIDWRRDKGYSLSLRFVFNDVFSFLEDSTDGYIFDTMSVI